MADDADLAEVEIARELEREIAATRALIPGVARETCVDCGEELEQHRKSWGICIECRRRREMAPSMGRW